jgi:multiple sugar transport system substrate-binding protein
MLQREQYEPWLNANSALGATLLPMPTRRGPASQGQVFGTMKNLLERVQGPISTGGAVNADHVLVQMASVATDAATPEAAAAEARRAKRYFHAGRATKKSVIMSKRSNP